MLHMHHGHATGAGGTNGRLDLGQRGLSVGQRKSAAGEIVVLHVDHDQSGVAYSQLHSKSASLHRSHH